MKKISSLLIVLFAILLFPNTAFAVDYSIEKMNIDAHLQENGDVHVTEKQTYHFDSKFNGITRTLIPKKGTDIVNVEAYENNEPLEVEQDGNLYKFHRKGKKETVTVEVTYEIKEAVTVYSDVAEFYWPFFDSGNESDYEQLEVTVRPPQATTDVIAFGYDVAQGTAVIKPNGDVNFNFGSVYSGEKGDIRVAYDKDLFSGVTVTEETQMRGKLEAERQRLIDKQIKFEKQQDSLRHIAPYIIIILTLICVGFLWFARQKKKMVMRDVERQFPPPYFVPEELMSLPATLFFMKDNMVQPEILSAALMDLVRKGYVEKTKDDGFKVISRNTMHEHETLLINWLCDEIGHEGIFRVGDLTAYIKDEKNQATYQKDYTAWQAAVQDEKNHYDLFSKNTKARLIVSAIGLLIIPFIIFLGIYELYMFMTFGILLAIGFFIFAASFRTYTVAGVRIKRDWKTFQDNYPKLANEAWDELNTDDQKRAFIYGIGINDKKIEQKNEILLNRFPTESYTAANPLSYLFFATLATGSFNHAQTTSATSTGGS